jgi:hypothetical protein
LHEGAGLECVQTQRRRAADQGAPQVQGIRHQREALRRRQGRQRHLRHGHHDGARRQGAGRPEPPHQATRWRWSRTARQVTEVIIQEGVPTYERINDAVAEPVVYMIDRYVVGGFYRVHAERGIDENLNAPGASFVPLAFAEPPLPRPGEKPGASAPNRFYMYGVIGRLAMLAASYELEATDPERRGLRERGRATCTPVAPARGKMQHKARQCPCHARRFQAPLIGAARHLTPRRRGPGRPDARRAGRGLWRHRHQPAVCAEGGVPRTATCHSRPTTSWACCR